MGMNVDGSPNVCPHCNALHFVGEKSNECCMYGDIDLEPLPEAPDLIKHLFDPSNTSSQAVNFRKNITLYNNHLSFGSLTSNIRPPPGRGPPVVLMNGQLTQQIGNVLPGPDREGRQHDPLYQQIYTIDDPDQQTELRMNMRGSEKLNQGLLQLLERLIQQENPYAKQLKTLGQRLREAMAGQHGENPLPPPRHFVLSILDNRPSPDTVCAVFDTRDNDPPDPSLCGIWIEAEGNKLRCIGFLNKNSDWILYALMFPKATQTYGMNIPRNKNRPLATNQIPDIATEILNAIESERPIPPPSTQPQVAEPEATEQPQATEQEATVNEDEPQPYYTPVAADVMTEQPPAERDIDPVNLDDDLAQTEIPVRERRRAG
jgi:hypothetical protein